MRRRTLLALLVVLALAAAVVVVVLLRRVAPPEPARLLPPADAFVYFDLEPLRLANLFRQMPAAPLDPEYAKFVAQTGFRFERDLDEAAFAVHYPPAGGASAQPPAETRFSEVFVARFDSDKVAQYLRSVSSVENYRDVDIYRITLPGRTLRVAILGPGLVGASNHDDPQVIRGIIDRSKKLARPFLGPALLRHYYRYVPYLSVAWVVARLSTPAEPKPAYPLPGGLALSVPPGTVLVASASYTGALQLRAQAFSQNQADARRLTDQLSLFLAMFRSVEARVQPGGPDPDVKAFFDSLKVTQHEERTELTATLTQGFLKKLLTEPPSLAPPAPEKPVEKGRKRKPPRKAK
jgi:hypothetical protein